MSFVNSLSYKLTHSVMHLDYHQFTMLTVCVLLVGFLCMRGYGSRINW
jgi:hypothetical protein